MGYLICDSCEGYYELQPGERTGDFDKCRCGGELKWVAKLPTQQQDEDTPNKKDEKVTNLFPCPDCLSKISRKAKSCPNCGYQLNYEDKHGHKMSRSDKLFGGAVVIVLLTIFINNSIIILLPILAIYFLIDHIRN